MSPVSAQAPVTALVTATDRLLRSGEVPSLARAARAADLPVDFAERSFPSQAALLLEAALLLGLPDANEVLRPSPAICDADAVAERGPQHRQQDPAERR